MPLPPSFATDYRRIVLPKLRSKSRFAALMIALNGASFAVEFCNLRFEAARLGAVHLTEELMEDLFDQIEAWLLADLDAVLAEMAIAEEVADRVGRDIAHHERQLRETVPP